MSMTWDTKALEIDRADDHQYFFLLVTFKLSVNVHTCASIMATSWITHPRLSILSNPFLSSNVIFTSLDLTLPPVGSTQLRQGPARCHQEDHEALLDPRVEQEDLPRVEVVEASEA
jgi:hypothetical protein